MPEFRGFQYHGPARSVRGGIKAQTKRGDFGKSWWGKRWLETLESFNLGGRLSRGKTYARNGQVIDLTVSEGKVTASVQGSRKAPYKVTIEMKTINEETWHELAHSSFNQALIAAQLLSGTMPENVETLFQEKGLNLFPLREADLKTDCSCPDYSNPCKHIAAVYLLLGEEFDREPFLIFKLRGMSRVKLLRIIFTALERGNKLTKHFEKPAPGTGTAKTDAVSDNAPVSKPEYLPTAPSLFWIEAPERLPRSAPQSVAQATTQSGAQPASQSIAQPASQSIAQLASQSIAQLASAPTPARIPTKPAQLLKTIGNPPFWRANENFMDAMDTIYQNASKYATRFLIDEEATDESAKDQDQDAKEWNARK